jgi:hypothetical protein
VFQCFQWRYSAKIKFIFFKAKHEMADQNQHFYCLGFIQLHCIWPDFQFDKGNSLNSLVIDKSSHVCFDSTGARVPYLSG